jgi:MFS family permease
MAPHDVPIERQPFWFMALFALAVSGGSIAYVPLLTVLLPLKISALLQGQDVAALARVTFFGAIIASLANIAFGMLSDRFGNRIGWIASGLVVSSLLLIAIGEAASLSHIIVLVMGWQIGLNMMLAPLFAWAGDCFPDEQKGTLGGFLAFAPAVGALAGSLVTLDLLVSTQWRLVAVAAMVVILVTPALVFGRRQTRPALMRPLLPGAGEAADTRQLRNRGTAARMWVARFLVQISEAGLFAFLLFWLRSILPDFHENSAANIFSLVLFAAVPVSLWLGSWSDRRVRPILPLVVMALIAAVGLLAMAFSQGIAPAIAGYVIFGIASAVFLSLHTAQTLRVLPKPQYRGRDLGVFNLTNTVPSLVMPWLTLTLVPAFGFSALFVCFAILVAAGAGLLASVASRAKHT